MAIFMNVGKPLQTSDNIFMTEWVAIFRESGLQDDVTIANVQGACLKLVVLANAILFTKFLFTIFVPLAPPSQPASDGFPLEFLLEGPQTELRALSQNCEQILPKLRTNRIMNGRF